MLSEPVFVENPTKQNDNKEDDGVLLTTLFHDDPTDVSLIIINASDMTEVCEISFKAEGTVTSTFHGIFNFKINK
jgi:carotenoid cleavage dioxygenase-like enzyme